MCRTDSDKSCEGIGLFFYENFRSKLCPRVPLPTMTRIVLDGGNVVDNFVDKAVVTKRLLKDNNDPQDSRISAQLKSTLGYPQMALIEDLGDATGHADGMVAFMDTNVLGLSGTMTGDNNPKTSQL